MKTRFMTFCVALALALTLAGAAISQNATTSGGRLTPLVATAYNVDNQAWLYTSSIATSTPVQTTGQIQISATRGTTAATANDRAGVTASFRNPSDNQDYRVTFTSLASAGQMNSRFGGIAFARPVFGTTEWTYLGLPAVTSYIAVLGNATIMRGNDTIATNQPAMVILTQAIHDANQNLLTEPDPSRNELHLIVPGSLMTNGTAVSGFPNGYFYIYWPDAAFQISNLAGATSTIPAKPSTTGRGPETAATATPMRINLTNTGINKDVGTTSAGLYSITLVNTSNKAQGLYMSGTDLCCTEFNRFSNILAPGKSQTFRFFFAPGKVVMRPFCCAVKRKMSYSGVNWTGPATSIIFE